MALHYYGTILRAPTTGGGTGMTHGFIRDNGRQPNMQAGVGDTGTPRDGAAGIAPDGGISHIDIANALAYHYDCVYYIDLDNDHYVEYTSSAEYQALGIEVAGDDFFADSARTIRRIVHRDDQAFALMIHQKAYLLGELDRHGLVSVTYRIMFDGIPRYYNGRFTRSGHDGDSRLIVGWANVDSEVRRERDFEAAQSEHRLLRDVNKALTSDYVKVYYVDLSDDSYRELTPDPKTGDLVVTMGGRDFFEDAKDMARLGIYHADMARFVGALHREHVLELMEDAPFILTYRALQNGRPVWHTLKALYSDRRTHMLVAVRDIDIQKRRETDYEHKIYSMSQLINRDIMTGVKNKNAFLQEESKWNQQISDAGGMTSFAVAVCDINDLKLINDTQGHAAGDQAIIDAARIISDIFKHSPVFRIGGDEFAIVLSGRDYSRRSALMGQLEDRMRENAELEQVILASGISAYDPVTDDEFADVFRRADTRMYEKKRQMKGSFR